MPKSHVSDELKKNVEELRAWMRGYINGADGESLSESAFRIFNRCEKVCDDLLNGKEAIPVYLETVDMTLLDKKSNRRAVLQVMIIKCLKQLADALPEDRHWFLDRVVALSESVPTGVQPVLMPDSERGQHSSPGGFMAHAAKDFFGVRVRSVLKRLDDIYPHAAFEELAPEEYDHGDPNNVACWGHAWTQATAAVATNWLQHEGGNTIDGVVQLMLAGRSDSLVPKKRGIGTLPSDDPELRLELTARPLLCQVLHHNPHIGDNAFEVVYLNPRYIGSEPRGGVSHPTARGLIDIYFTTWVESFATQLVGYKPTF